MKKLLFFGLLAFAIMQTNYSQETAKGSFEGSIIGADFVDRTSLGFSFGFNKNWHENFQIGVGFQAAFNRQSNAFGYEVFSPYFSSTALTINNTAQLYSLGKFSVEANANFGWLFINLQDEDLVEYNPALNVFQPETIAWETFRFLQGGFTLNYQVNRKEDLAISIFARALKNQALGNVRFGGEDANSNFQFNLGVKITGF